MESKNGNFFTRFLLKKRGEENTIEVAVESTSDETLHPTNAETLPHTVLTFTPEQVHLYDVFKIEELQKLINQFPPLRIGEINFIPIELGAIPVGGYYVKVIIRNGKDLTEDFTIENLALYLVDATGEKVAGSMFTADNFGALKFGESRIWTFAFRAEQVMKEEPDFSSASIAFE